MYTEIKIDVEYMQNCSAVVIATTIEQIVVLFDLTLIKPLGCFIKIKWFKFSITYWNV